MPCYRCGRIQDDPPKGASPWARAVIADEQVLVCPSCQTEYPDWVREARSCPRCSSTRLQIQLGLVVCRQCGHHWEARTREAPL